MATKKCKVIVVMDAEYQTEWLNDGYSPPQLEKISAMDIQDNLPDWLDLEVCKDNFATGGFYRLSNPTVYASIENFEADRRDATDHFAPSEDAAWKMGTRDIKVADQGLAL